MAKLMEGPSIESLATETVRLVAGEDSSASALTADRHQTARPFGFRCCPLREGSTGPPLILLPALGGDARITSTLCRQLNDDQAVYVFRPRGLDQELSPHTEIADMAEDYLTALRELHPTQPPRFSKIDAGSQKKCRASVTSTFIGKSRASGESNDRQHCHFSPRSLNCLRKLRTRTCAGRQPATKF